MTTECTATQLEFQSFGRRRVTGRFDGGRLTSDAGGLLLREVEQRLHVLSRLAGCFTDYRHAGKVEHSVESLLAQRIYGLALGYEDINDHDVLRSDSLLALLVGKADLTGAQRRRVRDQGYPLAGSSTLNRLELGTPEQAPGHRYQKVVADPAGLDRLLVDVFLESQRGTPSVLWLDLDATDDPLHGAQEGRFFHGYYKSYCYLPLYIFCGEHLLGARLRPADRDASAGSVDELARIIEQIRARWPKVRIIVRGDSGFCREELMAWCEAHDVGYLLGLAKNPRLEKQIARALRKSQRRSLQTGRASRRFRELRYRTRQSWSRTRRVVAKAEYLAKGRQSPFRGHQPGRKDGRRAAPVRGVILYPWGDGEPHQGAATGPVRRPHQHGHPARQPVAPVPVLVRLPADARPAPPGTGRHPLGPGAMRHHPHPYPETGRRGAHQRPPGLAGLCLRLPGPGRVRHRAATTARRAGARPACLTCLPDSSPRPTRQPCRERRPLAGGAHHARPGRATTHRTPEFVPEQARFFTCPFVNLPRQPLNVCQSTTDSLFTAVW